MAQFQWTFDAPTGTFKQHELSSRLYEAAVEDSVFMEYVQPVQGYGKKMGENVTLTRIKTITEPTTARLTEGQPIPEDSYSLNTVAVTPHELGRSVPFTSLAEDLSFFDVENSIQKKLKQQMKLCLDTEASNAFTAAKVKYVPTGLASSTTTTNGTAGAAATANLNVFHLEEIHDYMYDTLFCDPYSDEDYIGIFRTLALRGVMRDPAWEEWHKYTNPAAKFNGEVGRIENIRLMRTNHADALAKVGTGSVLGEGVVFGADAVAMAEVQTPELRAALPQDFGRSKAVAWYGNLGFQEIWDTGNAGEAKIVHITST